MVKVAVRQINVKHDHPTRNCCLCSGPPNSVSAREARVAPIPHPADARIPRLHIMFPKKAWPGVTSATHIYTNCLSFVLNIRAARISFIGAEWEVKHCN